jgi:hypothetical protein
MQIKRSVNMKVIKNNLKTLKKKNKNFKMKDLFVLLGIGSLMCIGWVIGSVYFGLLGAGFGLALGYVSGKLIIHA